MGMLVLFVIFVRNWRQRTLHGTANLGRGPSVKSLFLVTKRTENSKSESKASLFNTKKSSSDHVALQMVPDRRVDNPLFEEVPVPPSSSNISRNPSMNANNNNGNNSSNSNSNNISASKQNKRNSQLDSIYINEENTNGKRTSVGGVAGVVIRANDTIITEEESRELAIAVAESFPNSPTISENATQFTKSLEKPDDNNDNGNNDNNNNNNNSGRNSVEFSTSLSVANIVNNFNSKVSESEKDNNNSPVKAHSVAAVVEKSIVDSNNCNNTNNNVENISSVTAEQEQKTEQTQEQSQNNAEQEMSEREARKAKLAALKKERQRRKEEEWIALEDALAVIDSMQFD